MQTEQQAANERAWNAMGPDAQQRWCATHPGLRPENDFDVFGASRPVPVVVGTPNFQFKNVIAALVIIAVLVFIGVVAMGPRNIHSSYSDNQGNSLTSDCVVNPGAGTVSCNSSNNFGS